MAKREVTQRRLKKYSIGDLRERIVLHKRTLTAPIFDTAEPSETYDDGTKAWASISIPSLSGSGKRLFDEVNLADRPSHLFVIRFREFLNDLETPITSETIIHWQGDAYKIVLVLNPEERNEYLELFARLMGDELKEANQ